MATISTDLQHYLILFLLWLISTLFLLFIFRKPTCSNLPPSPPALPAIGHLHLLSKDFFKSCHQISSKYGPLLYLRFGSLRCVLISSASLATEIFKTHDLTLSGKPKPIFEDRLLFGNSGFITSQYGDYWRFMKKLCMTELLGARQIQMSRGIRREELIRFLHKLLDKASKNQIANLGEELLKLTNNATCRMAMSTRYSEEDGEAEKCRKMVSRSLDLAAKMGIATVLHPLKRVIFWIHRKQISDLTTNFDSLLERILKEHEERIKRVDVEKEDKDLMDILLEACQDEKAEVKINRTHIKAFILDLFIAGTSTTADTTQWAMAELINHPNKFKKVREEIELVVGKSRLVEESDIPSLPYLQAVVKETLRIHAPLPVIPRACLQSCKFGDFDIPEGTMILINARAMMRDPNFWDNPNEFYPERFMDVVKGKDNIDHNQKETKGLNNFSFLPFGVGRRMCPGSTLALTSINTILATLIQCFDWQVGGDRNADGTKVNMEVGTDVTVRMAYPLQCIPKVHLNPFAV